MLVNPLGIATLVRWMQPEKTPSPMLVTLLGIVTLVRLVHLANAYPSMLVTLLGIVTLVRLVHSKKELYAIFETPWGIVILDKFEHLKNAATPMLVTLSGIVMLVRLVHWENADCAMATTLTPLSLSGTESIPLNPLGASNPMITACFQRLCMIGLTRGPIRQKLVLDLCM